MKRIKHLIHTLVSISTLAVFSQSRVTWQQQTAVTAALDGSITATNNEPYASHAYSVESITSEKNGSFEFAVNNCLGVIGITIDPQGGGYEQIDYAFQLSTANKLSIVENGITRTQVGTWTKGDILKIQKYYNSITYFKNGSQIYTSTVKSNSINSYYIDFAIQGIDTGFDHPLIWQDDRAHIPFWQARTAVTEFQDGSIASTSNAPYASHAYSVESIPGSKNGYFEFIADNCLGIIGLTSDPQGGGYLAIDYAFQLKDSNKLSIIENGTTVAEGEIWGTGDVLKILKYDGVISYIKNGIVFYTSLVTSNTQQAYYADFAFAGTETGFDRPLLWVDGIGTEEFWQEKFEVTELGDASIISASNDPYASHAYSIKSIPGDKKGYFEFTVNNCKAILGLSSTPQGGGFAQIDYAFELGEANELNIIENGTTKAQIGKWGKGDVLKINKDGNTITYYKNGVLKYTSIQAASTTAFYHVDFAFAGTNTGFDKPVIFADLISAVDDSEIANNTGFYPNPATDHITVTGNFEGFMSIYSSTGSLVKSMSKTLANSSFDINLPTGIYLLKFKNEDKEFTKPMIVR